MSAMLVLDAGLFATIQGQPRPGRRAFGVPTGGAFDRSSLDLANALLGNAPDALALELTMRGGAFRALECLPLALAGAPLDARVRKNGGEIRLAIPQSFTLDAGDCLSLGGSRAGLRAYLAVRGGWRTDRGPGEMPLIGGTILEARGGRVASRRPLDPMVPDATSGSIRLIDGPDGPVPSTLLGHAFTLASASDRVGLRLDGPTIAGATMPDRISAPVDIGAVQVAGGRAMILGVAGGTIGGYPHVAHVIAADIDRLGQARPGDALHFERIGIAEARRLDRERRGLLRARDRRIGLIAGGHGVD